MHIHRRTGFLGPLVVATCCLAAAAHGQTTITPTTGFGAGGAISTAGMPGAQTVTIPASAGTQAGANLFHSFSQFDVGHGDTALFTPTGSTAAINNIIARIYSASPSSINGSIVVDPTGNFSGANLFLVNPNGVIFGANASVSVPGDFIVSTSNYIKTGAGVFYSDPTNVLSGADSLTAAPISAFGFFKGTTPAAIAVNGANLVPGGNLQFIGGNFTAAKGATLTITKPSASLGIFSGGVASGSTDAVVPYTGAPVADYDGAANFSGMGRVFLGTSNGTTADGTSTISTTGSGSGVVIRGGWLVQLNSASSIAAKGDVSIHASSVALTGSISSTGGNIGLDTTGNMTLTGGMITSSGGAITLGHTSLVNLTLDLNSSITETTGAVGALSINSTGAVTNAGTISAADGNGVFLSADSLGLSGTISTYTGELDVDTTHDMTLTGGTISTQGGMLNIGGIALANLSLDASSSITAGAGGTLVVTARGNVTLAGGSLTTTAMSGTAGTVTINTAQGLLTLTDGAQIASIAGGTADAGNVTLAAHDISVTGTGVATPNSGFFSISNGSGNAGNVGLNGSGNVTFSSGGQMASIVTGDTGGHTGGINIVLLGSPSTLTLGGLTANATTPVPIIYTSTANPAQTSGGVSILAFFTDILLQPGSAIQTSSQDALAGDIFVLGGSVTLDTNSAIQSVMSQADRSDNAKTGQTGAVEVVALNLSTFPFAGPISIADGAFIQTVANPNIGGFNPIGQVYVYAATLTEGGVNVPVSDNLGDYGYQIHGHTNIRMFNATTFGGPNGTDQTTAKPIVATLAAFPSSLIGNPGTIPTPPPGNGLVLDGTLGGTAGAIVPQFLNGTYQYTITTSDGLVAGNNLFLSFSQFDLGVDHPDSSDPSKVGPVAETAVFDAPNIANILLRVTSGSPSEINGVLLESARTTANLFLLNPSGLLFATNSTLNLHGALTLSTANAIHLSTGGAFETQVDALTDNLISAAPSVFAGHVDAFQFTSTTPAAITFSAATLSNGAATNNEINVIGGDLTFGDQALLNASQTLLFSAASPGTLTFTSGGGVLALFPPSFVSSTQILDDSSFTALGTVTFGGGSVLTVPSPNIASTILIRAANFNLNDSFIVDQTTADQGSLGGQVLVDVTGAVTITSATGPSFISTSSLGASDAGSIQINAANLTITGAPNDLFPAGILSIAQPENFFTSDEGYVPFTYATPSTATGNAGSITLDIAGALSLSTFGQISTDTNGHGNAGTITIRGQGSILPQVTLTGGSAITSSTSLSNPAFTITGNAGRVALNASSLALSGNLTLIASSAGIPINTSGPTGNGGNVTLTVTGMTGSGNGDITISNGAQVSASSFNNGQGGVVVVSQSNAANGILIDGAGSASSTGIFAAEFGDGSSSGLTQFPNAIDLMTASPLTLRVGGQITTSAGGNGSAGPIHLVSGNVTIDGMGANAAQDTGIFSSSTGGGTGGTPNPNATGNGGDIVLNITGDVKVANDGAISAASQTVGAAGVIAITQSGSAGIVDPATNPATNGGIYISSGGAISTAALGLGAPSASNSIAGNITLNTQALTLDNGQIISSTSGLSKAGDIVVGAVGGTPPAFVVVQGGGSIASNTGGTGDGGMINVTAGSLVVTGAGSTISTGAIAGTGGGGSIQISVVGNATIPGARGDLSVINGGAISASSLTTGEAGTVNITQSGSLDLVDPTTNPEANGGIFLDNGLITTAASGLGTTAPSNSHAGDITLNGEGLTLTGGARVLSSTAGASHAGNVIVGGPVPGQPTRFVMLQDGASIASETGGTNGSGNGGTVTISANSVINDHATISTSATAGSGRAGDIFITTPASTDSIVRLRHGGTVTSASASTGAAGIISITAPNGTIVVTGSGSAISTDAGSVGRAGNALGEIELASSVLDITDSGLVSATTGGLSSGGTIIATVAQSVSLVAQGRIDASSTAPTGGGQGGSVLIGSNPDLAADNYGSLSPVQLNLSDHSVISADSSDTNGGNILIHAENVDIEDNSLISTNEPNGASGTVGGNITIRAGDTFYLNNYSFVDSNAGQGTGGNIKIDPQFVVLNHSGINAIGGLANGNVEIDSQFLLSSASSITATGIVVIDSPPLDLSGSLIALPGDLTDDEKRLRETCARSVNHEFSSLAVVGRGGIEIAPTERSPDIEMP